MAKLPPFKIVDPDRDPDESGILLFEEIDEKLSQKSMSWQMNILVNLMAQRCFEWGLPPDLIASVLRKILESYDGKETGEPPSDPDPSLS